MVCTQCLLVIVFFFKQKTAYEMRISDWSSDVCSSDLELSRTMANIAERSQRIIQDFVEKQHGVPGDGGGQALGISDPLNVGNAFLEMTTKMKIGRASCRERVCQYV